MNILSVQNVSKFFGATEVFHNVSFNVNDNDRLAIIGNNGTGKSTLLKMILGKEEISIDNNKEKGQIVFSKGLRIGYLSQDVINSLDNTLREEALLVFKDVIAVENQLNQIMVELSSNPENKDLEKAYGKKLEQFEMMGGYDYHYQIDLMLNKFGFNEEIANRPIKSFSGGERTKMAFVKLLLLQPELLILDEPTNHLDVSTIDWLENYLKGYKGAILFVSHDRYFINNVANKIIEIEHNQIETYKGNFDYYVEEKKLRYEQALKEYNIQQKEIEKIKRFIEYFKPKPRFVNRAKDREKKLEHMVIKDKPLTSQKAMKLHFDGEVRHDKKIIYFDEVSIGYDKPLINPFSFYLYGGDKLAIMGDNGTGKTTLIKTFLQSLKPLSGSIVRLHPLNVGYIQQNDFDLNYETPLLEYFLNLYPLMGEKEIRNHLGKFGFHADDVFKNVNVLSGGEKMKVVMATIVLKHYDVLILDEPTNHLDMITKEALISALQQFNACIIFISHDRYFINEIANKVLYISNTMPYYNDGNYDDFVQNEKLMAEIKANMEPKIKETKSDEKKNKKSNVSLSKIEKEIETLEGKIKTNKAEQFKEENYLNSDKMKVLTEEEKNLSAKLQELTDLYLSLVD